MTGNVDHDALAAKVASSMPRLQEDLARLVGIPSVSVLGFPPETRPALLEARDAVSELLRDAGVEKLEPLELPDTAPVIVGEIPAPDGAPTVLLYGHYDVVPVGDEAKWESPPFEATERDGAIFGRGAADSKSNILMHVGALRAWEGRPPVGIKVVVEGQEETGSAFTTYPPTRPELFAADAMVIGDMGSIRPGVPTLTVGLRGMARGHRAGANPRRAEAQRASSAARRRTHSSCSSTPSPRSTTSTATSSSPACAGRSGPARRTATRSSGSWPRSCPACRSSGRAASASACGPGPRSRSRAWTSCRSTRGERRGAERAREAQPPDSPGAGPGGGAGRARATPRVDAPLRDRARGRGRRDGEGLLRRHVRAGVRRCPRGARDAPGAAESVYVATGGSIPLVSALSEAAPDAEILLFGTTDGFANIHAPNERVLLDEFEKAVLAEAELFGLYADAFSGRSTASAS